MTYIDPNYKMVIGTVATLCVAVPTLLCTLALALAASALGRLGVLRD